MPQQLVAGGVGRMFAQMIMYPADALRTLSQTRAGAKGLKELGARTLFNGAITTSFFALPLGAVQFTVFPRAQRMIQPRIPEKFTIAGNMLASAMASVASCVVGVPQEVIKQRLVTGE